MRSSYDVTSVFSTNNVTLNYNYVSEQRYHFLVTSEAFIPRIVKVTKLSLCNEGKFL